MMQSMRYKIKYIISRRYLLFFTFVRNITKMLNKLVTSISGVFNKWRNSDADDKLFYFVMAVGAVYLAFTAALLIQCVLWEYNYG